MFKILEDLTILLTRGDVADISLSVPLEDGSKYTFIADDDIAFRIMQKKNCDEIILDKRIAIESDTTEINIHLSTEDTRIGEVINKPVDYWYEIELNPDTNPQTLIGYDENGPKIFRLYPEGV